MNELCKKLEPTDLIAFLILLGAFILKFKGADGTTTAIISAVSFYYFGKKTSSIQKS